MNITRRNAFKGMLAAGALPLFNISALAGKGSVLKWNGRSITNNNKEANRHVAKEYRSGWNPFA